MNRIISILRFGSVAWIKGLWRTLLPEVKLLLWMISLFWTAKNPTNHQVFSLQFSYTWIYCSCGIEVACFRKYVYLLCKNLQESIWQNVDSEVLFLSAALSACGCSFEDGLCVWVQGAEDKLDWLSRSGPTESPNTGPAGDHTTGKGHFYQSPKTLHK